MSKGDRTRTRTLTRADIAPQSALSDDMPDHLFAGLTVQETEFVKAYVACGNAYEAYVKAGLEHGQRYPRKQSWQYLQRSRVKYAVHRVQTFVMQHLEIDAAQILGLLHAHATFDASQLYEQDGDSWALKPMSGWSLEARQCVQRIRVIERTSKDGELRREIDLEFSDRQRALALLGKHLKLFEKQRQIAPFTLVLNTSSEPAGLKQVGSEVIQGIGLQINVPPDER